MSSLVNMMIDGNKAIQDQFFQKLDSSGIDTVIVRKIKDDYMVIKLDTMAEIIKEANTKIQSNSTG